MAKINNPHRFFYFFEEISKIPRGSGNEKQSSEYVLDFAKKRNLSYSVDELWNVIVKKEGTPGYENAPPIILQGHLDMVCEKNKDVNHDFMTQGISILTDGDFIKADGTTLGADNGIAVAYILAVLDAKDIQHPPIEAVFTTQEETGLKGAQFIDVSSLQGKRLLNLDSETEGVFLVSCAGGLRGQIHIPVQWADAEDKAYTPYVVQVKGLQGGHSGGDIHKERGNANKILGRILFELDTAYGIKLLNISGGSKDNAIPREAEASFLISKKNESLVKPLLATLEENLKKELKNSDKGVTIAINPLNETILKHVCDGDGQKIIAALMNFPNGIQHMSTAIENLVETSVNLGVITWREEEVVLAAAIRSSVVSRKYFILKQLNALAKMVSGYVTYDGDYPAWEYNEHSELLNIAKRVYKEMYAKEVVTHAIHAGLECGVFAEKIKGIEMISLAPDIYDAHSPNERMCISSAENVWHYLVALLKNLKA